jgi:hypothetical protein
MPTRSHTRAQSRASRIAAERAHNRDDRLTREAEEADNPPPF